MQDYLNQVTEIFTPVQIAGAVLVALFLFKKLVKWAVIVGALLVVLPYLNDNGFLDTLKSQLGY
jgi:hypothetical protein